MAGHSRRFLAEPVAAKVPEITPAFWVIKLLTTAGGEAASDYLALGSHLTGAAVETGLLAVGLIWQFRVRRYTAAAYWFLAYAITRTDIQNPAGLVSSGQVEQSRSRAGAGGSAGGHIER